MTKQEVILNADAEKTAEAIGIPMRRKGKNIQIICPGHEKHLGKPDGGFGSCILTDHGYHCFAAGCTVNIIQMVQEQSEINGRKMSYEEALRFVCDVNGFTLDEKDESKDYFPFSQDDLSLLGYKKSQINKTSLLYHFKPECIQDRLIKTIQPDKSKTKVELTSLYQLWHYESKECIEIIKESAAKELQKTLVVLEHIQQNPLYLSEQIENQNQDFLYLYEQIKIHKEKLMNLQTKISFVESQKEKRG